MAPKGHLFLYGPIFYHGVFLRRHRAIILRRFQPTKRPLIQEATAIMVTILMVLSSQWRGHNPGLNDWDEAGMAGCFIEKNILWMDVSCMLEVDRVDMSWYGWLMDGLFTHTYAYIYILNHSNSLAYCGWKKKSGITARMVESLLNHGIKMDSPSFSTGAGFRNHPPDDRQGWLINRSWLKHSNSWKALVGWNKGNGMRRARP